MHQYRNIPAGVDGKENGVDVSRRSAVEIAQCEELKRLEHLLRALRGSSDGVPPDILQAVHDVAPEGRSTYSE